MEVVFLPEAADDIERLFQFLLDAGNPRAAQKAMAVITSGIERLSAHPHAGLAMRDREPYRQLFIPFGRSAYVLRYRIDEDHNRLVIVRVWHGRETRN